MIMEIQQHTASNGNHDVWCLWVWCTATYWNDGWFVAYFVTVLIAQIGGAAALPLFPYIMVITGAWVGICSGREAITQALMTGTYTNYLLDVMLPSFTNITALAGCQSHWQIAMQSGYYTE